LNTLSSSIETCKTVIKVRHMRACFHSGVAHAPRWYQPAPADLAGVGTRGPHGWDVGHRSAHAQGRDGGGAQRVAGHQKGDDARGRPQERASHGGHQHVLGRPACAQSGQSCRVRYSAAALGPCKCRLEMSEP
jgi:hypothetical protein